MSLDLGTCAFCGEGGGYLGEQGDESSERLHSSVRKGEPGNYTYETFPGAEQAGLITWCGQCLRGLAHKYQRYDETNLRGAYLAGKLRLELDGLRWVGWEANEGAERDAVRKYLDDTAIHMEKLGLERDVRHMEAEQQRRWGLDDLLTTRGWRP